MGFFYYLHNVGFWKDERESNLLDGFAHFYDTYETLDKKYIAIGSIEPQFYKILIDNLGLNFEDFKNQMDKSLWPELKNRIAQAVSSKTRSEWTKIFSGTDACVTPVLSIDESFNDSHHLDRKTFTKVGDYNQPSPSPRFSSSSLDSPNLAHLAGADNDEIFTKFNLDPSKFK
jgi:alpha-methylacyl-CoA racemase